MEQVFEQFMEECSSTKFPEIYQNSCNVRDILDSSARLSQSSQSELRKLCFAIFHEALETKHQKLVSLAVSGMNKLLRDDQFYGKPEGSDETKWLVSQLMNAIDSLPFQPEEVQVEIVKIILGMCCLPNLLLSGHIVVGIVGVCGLCYGRGSSALKAVSQSAAIQCIGAFLSLIRSEMQISKDRGHSRFIIEESSSKDTPPPVHDEIVPLIYFISEKLTEAHRLQEDKKSVDVPPVFLLECAKSVMQALSNNNKADSQLDRRQYSVPPYCSTLLISSIWQRLCPSLIALLGTPVSSSVGRGSGRTQGQTGRGSGASSVSMVFDAQEAKAIYSVACSLVLAMGNVGEIRPVLESLFHRMILYPPPQARYDSLRAVLELFRDPEGLTQLAGPILFADSRNPYQCELGLLRLIMDSLTECSNCEDPAIQILIIESLWNLLSSLEVICKGSVLNTAQICHINSKYSSLEEVDYSGPMTYDAQLGLARERYENNVVSDGSTGGISLPENSDVIEDTDAETDIYEDGTCDTVSISSGDTEGPEEIENDPGVYDEELRGHMQESQRLQKLNENLEPKSNIIPVCNEDKRIECENAKKFCTTLLSLLPSLLTIRSTIEVDQAIVEFSSKYCEGIFRDGCRSIIINADGIYLATYSCLSLNLKLITSGFYCQSNKVPTMTKDQFMSTVFARGVLVYISSAWVGELYDQTLKDSFLQRAGYTPQSPYHCALINLLTDLEFNLICSVEIDMDGLGSVEEGSQMISDYRRLAKAAKNVPKTNAVLAGEKLARRIVTCCWESILAIQGTLLKKLESRGGILTPIRLLLAGENFRKEESRKAQDLLITCLSSLQSSARLANLLGLQKRCALVFSLLSSACLPRDDRNPISVAKKSAQRKLLNRKPLRLHRAHILSFHVMMECGLELGSHTSDCWSHLFRCSIYLAELERRYFMETEKASYSPRNLLSRNQNSNSSLGRNSVSTSSEENFCFTSMPSNYVEEGSVDSILADAESEISSSGFLTPQHSGKVLSCLTMLVDRFFESAANQLNLSALESFLRELCNVSQNQLFRRSSEQTSKPGFISWSKKKLTAAVLMTDDGNIPVETLFLHRLGSAMLRIVRSGRPLIHVMRVWSIVGPHFLEAACHKDDKVSKKAISCIHDVVNNLLGNQLELPHFHFNEALFKPFENLLCLELCDLEVQDQIVSSICEFVESCNVEIKSGWRPLFGALKCVRLSPIKSLDTGGLPDPVNHLGVVKDVFEAFLSTQNVLVFANAALDCIQCLLKYVKGSDESHGKTNNDLCIDALSYLHRINEILASMYNMPACPMFINTHRVFDNVTPRLVEATLPSVNELRLWEIRTNLHGSLLQNWNSYYACLWPHKEEFLLSEFDCETGILHIWFVLLEGLAAIAMTSSNHHQPLIVDALFRILRELQKCPGPRFGLYCVNHIILPTIQDWLRTIISPTNDNLQGFKQYVGHASETFVECIKNPAIQESEACKQTTSLALQQLFLALTECITHPSDVGRLGCSCIRHIVLSCGPSFTPDQWQITVFAIHRVSQVSLYPLYQLMETFQPKSLNFYGDLGQIKVAARRDCTPEESQKLRHLSMQVFQLDSQHLNDIYTSNCDENDDRSFIFLIYSDSKPCDSREIPEDDPSIRISFKSLILGLLANQMILQTLGALLLQGSPHVIPSLANVLLQPSSFGLDSAQDSTKKLPGMLKHLTDKQIKVLLDSLDISFKASVEFDARPGLKFLVQKVAQTDRAANLYKQAGASWTLRLLTIFELILTQVDNGLDIQNMRKELEQDASTEHGKRPSTLSLSCDQHYVEMLSGSFRELCEKYLELVSLNHEPSPVDRFHDEPMFFLTIPADEFPIPIKKNESSISDNGYKLTESCKDPQDLGNQSDGENGSSLPSRMTIGAFGTVQVEQVEDSKSFEFGDWVAKDYSESDSSEATKEEDSGVDGVSGITESIYSIATDKHVTSMMEDYRKQKNRHSVSSKRMTKRPNPFNEANTHSSPQETVPRQIEIQRKTSLMKDGEALLKIWTEMVITVFDLISQLEDRELKPILPLIFPTVQSLTAHAHDPHLRQVVAEMLGRVASLYGFSPSEK